MNKANKRRKIKFLKNFQLERPINSIKGFCEVKLDGYIGHMNDCFGSLHHLMTKFKAS